MYIHWKYLPNLLPVHSYDNQHNIIQVCACSCFSICMYVVLVTIKHDDDLLYINTHAQGSKMILEAVFAITCLIHTYSNKNFVVLTAT